MIDEGRRFLNEERGDGKLKRTKALIARLMPGDLFLFNQKGGEYFSVDEINHQQKLIRGVCYNGSLTERVISFDVVASRDPLVAYFREIKERGHLRFLMPEDALKFSDGRENEYLLIDEIDEEMVFGRYWGLSKKLIDVSMSFDEIFPYAPWTASFQHIMAEY